MATWTIETLESNIADGGVTVAHWICYAKETVGTGDDAVTYTASAWGTCRFSPDASADGFVPYADLTEADVLAWVWDSVDKDATEASLAAEIEANKNPVSTKGVPW